MYGMAKIILIIIKEWICSLLHVFVDLSISYALYEAMYRTYNWYETGVRHTSRLIDPDKKKHLQLVNYSDLIEAFNNATFLYLIEANTFLRVFE